MFVQVIQAKVSDPPAVQAALDRWSDETSPRGRWLAGTTAGVTADGTFMAVARFDSEESARHNSDRPDRTVGGPRRPALFDGPAMFHDSNDVIEDIVGDPERAGFVQIMQGHGNDPDRARELMAQDSERWAEFRPDVLGSIAAQYETASTR